MSEFEWIADCNDTGVRLDKCITNHFEELSRSHIQKLIREQLVTVNQKSCKANYLMKEGDILSFSLISPIEPEIVPQNMDLDVIYEDHDLIIINKPKGMVVHPAPGHYDKTLVNGLLYHCKDDLSGINGVMRPGIVHRIDKDTTGSVLVCKNDFTHNEIARQLKEHSIKRKYEAIVCGVLKDDEGTIESLIGRHQTDRKKMSTRVTTGKHAVTHYYVKERFKQYTYVECILETGRTHQIRVHMSSIGHPLLGDSIYGNTKDKFHLQGQTLHAKTIGFVHPRTNQYMEFETPLPAYFDELLDQLRQS